MIEYIEIGPTPCNENCAQVGQDNFRELATKEMDAFIDQLYRTFPEATEKRVSFIKKWFPHEFGTYGEVCIKFNDEYQDSVEFAFFVDRNVPENWDKESIKQLEMKEA